MEEQKVESLLLGISNSELKIIKKEDAIFFSPSVVKYPYLMNIIAIIILVYYLLNSSDITFQLVLVIIIGSFGWFAVNDFIKHNNCYINLKKKEITIIPFILLRLFIKRKYIKFNNIKKTIVVSNEEKMGFWLRNRLYFVHVETKNCKHPTIITQTNEFDKAKKISDIINNLLIL